MCWGAMEGIRIGECWGHYQVLGWRGMEPQPCVPKPILQQALCLLLAQGPPRSTSEAQGALLKGAQLGNSQVKSAHGSVYSQVQTLDPSPSPHSCLSCLQGSAPGSQALR